MRAISSIIALLICALAPANASDEPPFAIIVAPGSTDHRLTREAVALIFTRRQDYWADGTRIQPVNLPATHPVRRAFSLSVLAKSPEAMEEYWREMYFHGVLPPHVLGSEQSVLLFVSSTPGAIGYVSTCVPDQRVSVVLVVGDLPACRK
jgi:ABC-type phosphate transport system substrate-binding protein